MRNNYVESKYDSTVRLNFSLKIMVRTFYEDTGTRAVGLGTGLGVETDFFVFSSLSNRSRSWSQTVVVSVSKLKIFCTSNHRLFISRLETASFAFFFLHGSFFLEYADSLNQRNFFRFTRAEKTSSQTSRIRVTAKNFATRANLFSSILLSFFPRVCF